MTAPAVPADGYAGSAAIAAQADSATRFSTPSSGTPRRWCWRSSSWCPSTSSSSAPPRRTRTPTTTPSPSSRPASPSTTSRRSSRAAGVVDAFWRSVVAGVITVDPGLGHRRPRRLCPRALRLPGPRRLPARGALHARLPHRHPLHPAGGDVSPDRDLRLGLGRGPHAHRPGAALRGAHHQLRLRLHPAGARGGGADPGLLARPSLPARSPCRWPCRA